MFILTQMTNHGTGDSTLKVELTFKSSTKVSCNLRMATIAILIAFLFDMKYSNLIQTFYLIGQRYSVTILN